MSLLKQLDRAAKTCWCPSNKYPNLIASGTIAATMDDSFVSKSTLEIWDLDLASPSPDMRLLGAVESKDCFVSVAWGGKGIDDGSMSHGLLAGGMSDGSINIWNASGVMNRSGDALLARSEVHKGQVGGLQFHPQQPNLLASGGSTDGEVYVWDLANVKEPRPSKPNPSLKPGVAQAGVTALAWNKNAPQILASASEVGETTVWDLRQKRSIITIRNSARINVRAADLAWNPAAGVQLAVCYNNHPVAEIWDLRQSMTPKVKLEGFHSSSILALDWCAHDASLLVTTGEDTRMAAWNPLTGAMLHEINAGMEKPVVFDVQWSPKLPGVLSTCSYDGKVNVHSIGYTGAGHVPAWMTRPIGASFGFGGKLVSFGQDVPPMPASGAAPPTGGPPSPHKIVHPKVQLAQLVTDPEVLDKAAGLQQILKEADFPAFCAYKITHAMDGVAAGGPAAAEAAAGEQTMWTFMKILFEDESNQRFLLLRELGFEPPASSDIVIPQPSVPVVPNISEDDFFNQDFPTPKPAEGSPEPPAAATNMDGLKDALAGIAEDEAKEGGVGAAAAGANGAAAATAGSKGPFVEDSADKAIRQALVFGDFKAAVSKCLEVGRMADAIVFASFGPASLWEETRAAYFDQHRSPFIRNVMRAVSSSSLEEMVDTSPLADWKQTLAICITYTTTSKYRALVNQLAARLEQEPGMHVPAVVCYICSSNIDKAIEMWTSKIPAHLPAADAASGEEGNSTLLALHAAIEKIAVFAHATHAHQSAPSKTLSLKYAEYASMLASQGELRGAFNYLSRVATPNDANSAVLLDRIYHAESEQFAREQYAMPAFPFQLEPVQVDPTLAQKLQYEAQQKAARAQQAAAMAQQRAAGAHAQHNPHAVGGFQQQQPQQHGQPQQQQRPAQYVQPNGHPQAAPQYGQTAQAAYQQHAQTGYGQPPQQGQQQYGAPAGPYGQAPVQAQPQRPPFQPQQPQYGAPQPPQHHQPPPQQPHFQPHAPPPHAQPAPQQTFGQPQHPPQQPQYGQPQAQPQRPPAASPQGYMQPAQTGFGASQQHPPQQPHHAPPQPQSHFGAPVPAPQAVPAQPPQPAQPAPAPFVPAPQTFGAAAPNVMRPAMPSGAPAPLASPASSAVISPASAGAAAAAAAPSDPSVSLSPADAAMLAPLEACLVQLSACGLKTPEQKKVVEIRSKLTELARKVSDRALSPSAMTELAALSAAVAAGDFTSAQRHHLALVKTDWQGNNEWLLGLKTCLLMAKKYLEKTG